METRFEKLVGFVVEEVPVRVEGEALAEVFGIMGVDVVAGGFGRVRVGEAGIFRDWFFVRLGWVSMDGKGLDARRRGVP